ncbi:MAG TPA: hypothetical protein PJ997_00710 [Candidatus Paceibacterota bacterium]|nr:hypothetical protein [Candidatus Paceibacterota bacterium]HMP18846.1 hypothetical protein [Candidatus Paceibacterota bacterium]HMP85572.1 hypothetical protein [Candidatus Paceibacterota bacterium]
MEKERIGLKFARAGFFLVLAIVFFVETSIYLGFFQIPSNLEKTTSVLCFFLWIVGLIAVFLDRMLDRTNWFVVTFFLIGTMASGGIFGINIEQFGNIVIASLVLIFAIKTSIPQKSEE